MNADAFRHLYDYHFSENRQLWNRFVMALSPEQFVQAVNYSVGSIRNHIVHLMSVESAWFSGLRQVDMPDWLNPEDFTDRDLIRVHWDTIERDMRAYLATLTDAMLIEKPLREEEDHNLLAWQVLIHVVNHGTDHRAQLLRILHDLGIKTAPQDYIFFAYDNPLP